MDGRFWILGGLGVDSILKTTEILEEQSNGTWTVTKGPNLPRALFGHCVVALPGGNVLLSGGFDGIDQANITQEFRQENNPRRIWKKKSWSAMKTRRYDHSCIVQFL